MKFSKIYYVLFAVLFISIGCEWHLKPNESSSDGAVAVERYDRIESLYLTTGDFSALQQMNTKYPMQTRTLIEDVLQIGQVNDTEINTKFMRFFRDSVLQDLIGEVERQYANMDDINDGLTKAFCKLRRYVPGMETPQVYAQIGALDQSIVVGNGTLGIGLDKYLGADYPLYLKYYPEVQRKQMVRSMIVPDCMVFYILSLFPMPHDRQLSQVECDMHMGKIQWVVNTLTERQTFRNEFVTAVDTYMKRHSAMTVAQLLEDDDCKKFIVH